MSRAAFPVALFAVVCACASGCGSSAPEPALPASPVAVAEPVEDRAPRGALFRDDVDAAIADGLGVFLQNVSVKAHLEGGAFVGFRVVELRPPQAWDGVDLKPGDVVMRVNGMPIERDTEAFAAFESLRDAKSIAVKLLRGGNEKDLVIGIVDRPKKSGERVSQR